MQSFHDMQPFRDKATKISIAPPCVMLLKFGIVFIMLKRPFFFTLEVLRTGKSGGRRIEMGGCKLTCVVLANVAFANVIF